jgi:ubiquinone biosynthesis monooxygenase Coq7
MIRVDHAGEYGAMRIYEGQLAVLEVRSRDRKAVAAIRRMAEQESRHLERFDRLVNERKVRPTALSPLWQVAGFALGAGTALLGTRAAMACTAAVEEVIDEHYARQIERLEGDPELKEAVSEFRDDEIAHRDEALAHGAGEAPAYRLLSETIKTGCRLAIRLSEKI